MTTTERGSIYEIAHTPTARCYIGSSLANAARFAQHIWNLQANRHGNQKLQTDWNQTVISEWTFRILETGIDRDHLRGREAHWIAEREPYYNIKTVTPLSSRVSKIEDVLDKHARGLTMRQIAQLTYMSLAWVHSVIKRYGNGTGTETGHETGTTNEQTGVSVTK
jgi:GIY-YIG catalytic domain